MLICYHRKSVRVVKEREWRFLRRLKAAVSSPRSYDCFCSRRGPLADGPNVSWRENAPNNLSIRQHGHRHTSFSKVKVRRLMVLLHVDICSPSRNFPERRHPSHSFAGPCSASILPDPATGSPGLRVPPSVPTSAYAVPLLPGGYSTEPSAGLGRCRRPSPHGQRGGSWPSSRCGSGGRCGSRVGCGPAGGTAPPLPAACGGCAGALPWSRPRPALCAGASILAIIPHLAIIPVFGV